MATPHLYLHNIFKKLMIDVFFNSRLSTVFQGGQSRLSEKPTDGGGTSSEEQKHVKSVPCAKRVTPAWDQGRGFGCRHRGQLLMMAFVVVWVAVTLYFGITIISN